VHGTEHSNVTSNVTNKTPLCLHLVSQRCKVTTCHNVVVSCVTTWSTVTHTSRVSDADTMNRNRDGPGTVDVYFAPIKQPDRIRQKISKYRPPDPRAIWPLTGAKMRKWVFVYMCNNTSVSPCCFWWVLPQTCVGPHANLRCPHTHASVPNRHRISGCVRRESRRV
jgi:hypothetical protein